LSQGEKASVRIEGRTRDVEKIVARIENGSLIISGSNNVPVTVYVTVEELNRVEVNSSAKVYSGQVINSDILLLKVNGSGSIKLDVRTLSLGMIVKGKGKIVVSGSTGDSFARILGDGRILTSNLDAYSSRMEISKANTAYVKETDKSGRRLTLRMTN
jgi:formylmethanofuran dehydrogenase subunit C